MHGGQKSNSQNSTIQRGAWPTTVVIRIINLFPRDVFTLVDLAGSVISIFDLHAFEWNGVAEVDNLFSMEFTLWV